MCLLSENIHMLQSAKIPLQFKLAAKISTNTALKTLLLDGIYVTLPAMQNELSTCLEIGSSLQILQLHYEFVSLNWQQLPRCCQE